MDKERAMANVAAAMVLVTSKAFMVSYQFGSPVNDQPPDGPLCGI
jgi:hypothetical protein